MSSRYRKDEGNIWFSTCNSGPREAKNNGWQPTCIKHLMDQQMYTAKCTKDMAREPAKSRDKPVAICLADKNDNHGGLTNHDARMMTAFFGAQQCSMEVISACHSYVTIDLGKHIFKH